MFKADRLKLEFKGNQLLVKKTKNTQIKTTLFLLILSVAFFIGFYSSEMNEVEYSPFFVGMFIFSMAILLYNAVKIIIVNNYFLFDQINQTIYKKSILLLTFTDVEYVELRVITGKEKRNSYILNLRLKNKNSIELDNNLREDQVNEVSEKIAMFINKEVKKK